MTTSQTMHLIQQFADQCPFAIWVLDARGVAVFANERLHTMLGIPQRPSGALGINLFKDPAVGQLDLSRHRDRLMNGDTINLTFAIDDPSSVQSDVEAKPANSPLALRVVAYPLFSTTQKIEHYVVFIEDVSNTYTQKKELESQIDDVRTFLRSKESRRQRLEELLEEEKRLKSALEKGDAASS